MSYAEGAFSDQFDLLGKIKLFLEDNGWTTISYATDTSTYNSGATENSSNAKRLHTHKGTRYLNFRSTNAAVIIPTYIYGRRYGIGFNVGSGYDSSKGWAEQPGTARILSVDKAAPSYCWCNGSGYYRMFLFDDPFTFLIYIKHSSTFFSQIYFGEVSPKYGEWSGDNIFLSSWEATASYTDAIYTSSSRSFLSSGNFNADFVSSGGFQGALNILTPSVMPSGNTWALRGITNEGDSADSLFTPFLGWPASFGNTNSRSATYLMGDLNTTLLQCLPAAFVSPTVLLPIQPVIKNSLLGELPYMKMTAGPLSLQEQVVTYAGTRYILLPLGTPAAYTAGNCLNPLLAVEYEGA